MQLLILAILILSVYSDIDIDPNTSHQTTLITGTVYPSNLIFSAGDMNKDGYEDVIIPGGNGFTGMFLIFGSSSCPLVSNFDLNTTYSQAVQITSSELSLQTCTVTKGDLNNDKYSDIAINCDNLAYVIFGTANAASWGSLILNASFPQGFRVSNYSVPAKIVGDLNNDGFDDFWLGGKILFGDQNAASWGYLDVSSSIPTGIVGLSIQGSSSDAYAAGDLNKDGYDDLIVFQYTSIYNTNQFNASVLFGRADLNTLSSIDVTASMPGTLTYLNLTSNYFPAISFIDFNNDGYKDIFFTGGKDSDSTRPSYIVLSASNMSSWKILEVAAHTSSILPPYPNKVFFDYLGDINNDGIDDFMIRDGSRTLVVLGNGKFVRGAFMSFNLFLTNSSIFQITYCGSDINAFHYSTTSSSSNIFFYSNSLTGDKKGYLFFGSNINNFYTVLALDYSASTVQTACQASEYLQGSTCQKCSTHCISCNDGSSCLTCEDSYTLKSGKCSKPNIIAIVGGSIGGVLLLAVLAYVAYAFRKYRLAKKMKAKPQDSTLNCSAIQINNGSPCTQPDSNRADDFEVRQKTLHKWEQANVEMKEKIIEFQTKIDARAKFHKQNTLTLKKQDYESIQLKVDKNQGEIESIQFKVDKNQGEINRLREKIEELEEKYLDEETPLKQAPERFPSKKIVQQTRLTDR